MKIIILAGFLGAGKTTVLIQLAKRLVEQDPGNPNRVAIVENEVGSVGVDDQTLGGGSGYTVKSLFSGCICCTLAVELAVGVRKMRNELNPDYVIIEPTGVADPGYVAQGLEVATEVKPVITTLVDAVRWKRVVHAMAPLLQQQIQAAQLVLVTKADKASEEELTSVEADVRGFGADVPIVRVNAAEPIDAAVLDAIAGEGALPNAR